MTDKPTDNTPATTNNSSGPKGIDIADLIEYRKRGLSTTEIGKLTGCSHANVVQRLQTAGLENLDRFRDHKDTVFEHTQREIIKSVTGDKLKDMSGLQMVTAAAILEDKIRAIRGQANQIIEHRSIIADLRDAEQRLRDAGMVIEAESEPVDN